MYANRRNLRDSKEIWVQEHDGDVKPEVEIRPFRACAMKNTQYNAYLWPNRRNSRVKKNRGRVTRRWRQILDQKWKYSPLVFAPCIWS